MKTRSSRHKNKFFRLRAPYLSAMAAPVILAGTFGLVGVGKSQEIPALEVPRVLQSPIVNGVTEVNVVLTPDLTEETKNEVNEFLKDVSEYEKSKTTVTEVNEVFDDLANEKTVIIHDVSARDVENYQKGTLSKEGLVNLYLGQTEEKNLEEVVSNPDLLEKEKEELEEKPTILIAEEPEKEEEELKEQIVTARTLIKEAKENQTNLELALEGELLDLSVLTWEELNELNTQKPSDLVTEEFLRRVIQDGSGLTGYSNGEVPLEALVPLSWAPDYVMQKDAAFMFELMNRDFKNTFGYDFRITSTYRPLAVQYQVHEQNPAMTATPGTSNHGYGLAVDIASGVSPFIDYDSIEHQWIIEYGHKYGWLHPHWAAPGQAMEEPWHFEFGTYYPEVEKQFNNHHQPKHKANWVKFGKAYK